VLSGERCAAVLAPWPGEHLACHERHAPAMAQENDEEPGHPRSLY
jgi:hypothetical protein